MARNKPENGAICPHSRTKSAAGYIGRVCNGHCRDGCSGGGGDAATGGGRVLRVSRLTQYALRCGHLPEFGVEKHDTGDGDTLAVFIR